MKRNHKNLRKLPHQESSLSHFISHGHFVTEDVSGYLSALACAGAKAGAIAQAGRSKDNVNVREMFQRENMPRAFVVLWFFVFMVSMRARHLEIFH